MATGSQQEEMLRLLPASIQARPNLRLYVIITLAVLLTAAGTAWLMERQRPLTPEQEALLRAQVAAVAQQTGQSRQAVWSRVKRAVGVQRIEEIPQGDLSEAFRSLR